MLFENNIKNYNVKVLNDIRKLATRFMLVLRVVKFKEKIQLLFDPCQ